MRPEQQRLTPLERANLVAFLDGELSEVESQAISSKLRESPTARREAEVLEKTWELLEHLARPTASTSLTERTMTEVKRLSDRGGELETAFKHVGRKTVWASIWLLTLLLTFGLGYGLTLWVWPDPTARLARDLTLAEHLDEYRAIGSFEFLKELANSTEFGTDRDD
jgi:hypothetical protein